MKVCVCGAAGGIGQPLCLLLKNGLPSGSHLSMYDIVNVPGVAADLSHICTPVKVSAHIGADNLDAALEGCDVVVIPAGVPRKPGMTRDDLFNVNAGIIKTLIEGVVRNCPKAFLCIITNPVNSTVPIAAEILKKAGIFDAKRLFGISTLDIVRSNTFVAEAKGLDLSTMADVRVVGGHSGVTILPLLSQVPGVTFTAEEQEALTTRIQNAGTEVVEAKAGAGSATLSMAFAGARFTLSLIKALGGAEGEVQCAYVAVEGMDLPFFAVPVELGVEGVKSLLPIGDLNEFETAQMEKVKTTLEGNIKKGVEFANKQ